MTKRRMGTRPHHTFWTPEGVAMIEAYQAKHRIPSFSAAAETLVRMGLERSPGEILEPIIVSTIRQTVHRELNRLVRLQLQTALEAGMARRFASATLRDLGRTMTKEQFKDESGRKRYFGLKEFIVTDTRQSLARDKLWAVVQHLDPELLQTGEQAEQEQRANIMTLAEALGLDVDDTAPEGTG